MKPSKKQPQNTTMPIGTAVSVRRDDGSTLSTRTRSKPWQLGHGAWVVSVEGIAGGYDLGRVTPLSPEHHDGLRGCTVCGSKPVVPLTGMCGPCTFGEAGTAGGSW